MRETPTRTMSASWRPAADAVVEADGELDRLHALEVGRVERRARARRVHLRRHPRDAGNGFDRLAEQVAVVELRAPAERPHRVAELRFHKRVHDDGRPAAHPVHRELEVVLGLDPQVPLILDELLLGELRLERLHETAPPSRQGYASETTCSSTGMLGTRAAYWPAKVAPMTDVTMDKIDVALSAARLPSSPPPRSTAGWGRPTTTATTASS